MSNRKTRKQKILAQKREEIRKTKIKELEELKLKVLELENKISEQKKENFKQFNIRNLKVFANACNFAAPFVISTGITIGLFKLFGGGFPFHSDEITKYKVYNLDFQTEGNITMDEEYRTDQLFDELLPDNSLVIYTPWEEQDEQYIRYKREYNLEDTTTLDLYNAVLDEDYNYISLNLKDYQEEKQIVNEINTEEKNGYFMEASLHMFNKEDVLKYDETALKNIVITIIELVLSLGIGGAIAHFRDFDFRYELRQTNEYYAYKIYAIEPLKQELEETNEKILSLLRKKGGNVNE